MDEQTPTGTPSTLSGSDSLDLDEVVREVDDALKAALLHYADVMPYSLILMGKQVLGAPGRVMSWRLLTEQGEHATPPRWPLFIIQSYRVAMLPHENPGWREALPAAVALELAIAAADLIDEAADNDPSPIISEHGAGQAINTANLMLVMSQQVLLRQATGGNERSLAALGALQDMLVEAAVGQHLDMRYEKMEPQEVTPEMSGEMSDKKAGALIGGAFRIGSLVAGAEERVVDLLAHFGRQLGGMAQLSNDIQDVLPSAEASAEGQTSIAKPKTDLRQRKRTLPIVFALREEAGAPNPLQVAFGSPPAEDEDEELLRQAVVSAGGIDFAYLIMDVYKGNAIDTLDALEELRPGSRDILKSFLKS